MKNDPGFSIRRLVIDLLFCTLVSMAIDNIPSNEIKLLFEDFFHLAQRGKQLEQFEFINGHNVFFGHLWWSVKYEEVYLKAYGSIAEARQEIGNYFELYKYRRRHQSLDRRTPDVVYWATPPKKETAFSIMGISHATYFSRKNGWACSESYGIIRDHGQSG
ncbi:MAG TPA: transposase [Deltaproteobacteria bacterium]|nr:transposase [Deltaproteobacteria bacterium]